MTPGRSRLADFSLTHPAKPFPSTLSTYCQRRGPHPSILKSAFEDASRGCGPLNVTSDLQILGPLAGRSPPPLAYRRAGKGRTFPRPQSPHLPQSSQFLRLSGGSPWLAGSGRSRLGLWARANSCVNCSNSAPWLAGALLLAPRQAGTAGPHPEVILLLRMPAASIKG